ncbi:MAG: 50S ribosomal protein L30 [Bdellovibrionales bacterium]|nr:50S ribosomal protein L30 [Bdellovibrionales bacterium]
MAKRFFKIKQKRSSIGSTLKQKEALRCLGLRRPNHEVKVIDNPAMRGQILKIQHLVEVSVEGA